MLAARRYAGEQRRQAQRSHKPRTPAAQPRPPVDTVVTQMTDDAHLSPAQVFGRQLAAWRNRAGLTQEKMAREANISLSYFRKIEAGERTPTEHLAKTADDLCEAAAILMALFEQLRPSFRDQTFPTWFDKWPDYEVAAKTLRTFEPLISPGLLQVEPYARAVLSVWAIIDERCLHGCIGGPGIMRAQISHLREMVTRPNIILRVVPLSAGMHRGLNAAGFVIADLLDGRQAAYQDAAVSGQVIESDSDIEGLRLIWDTLMSEALPRTATLEILQEAEGEWTR
jgi:transcriptional regulator with XRE-family HTH domain